MERDQQSIYYHDGFNIIVSESRIFTDCTNANIDPLFREDIEVNGPPKYIINISPGSQLKGRKH